MISMRLARPLLALAALVAALAVGLHGGSPPSAKGAPASQRGFLELVPHSKVGQVEGTRAYIALSFDGKRLRVYTCDGSGKRRATISHWLQGRWDGHSPITLVRDGIEVHIDEVHPDGSISGSLRAFSGPHPFTVEPATGPAGLYDGIDRKKHLHGTWIVLANGSVRGNMVPTRPPRRVCRYVTVVLVDGTTEDASPVTTSEPHELDPRQWALHSERALPTGEPVRRFMFGVRG